MAISKATLMDLQRAMKNTGVYAGTIDGSWGPLSHGAFMNVRRLSQTKKKDLDPVLADYANRTAWSIKVSDEFILKSKQIAAQIGVSTDELMSCMAFETGETFSPTIKNAAGAPYYGLIQFGADAAEDMKTTLDKLIVMTDVEQLDYVAKYFMLPGRAGKIKNLGDLYLAILWPAAVGKSDDYVVFNKLNTKSKAYVQNKGLDVDLDGKVTRGECLVKINQKMVIGLHPSNLRV